MSEVFGTININNYKYNGIISINNYDFEAINYPVKLTLTSSNINLNYCNSDGSDIKICLSSNGSGCLYSWVQKLDLDTNTIIMWLKLPYLAPKSSTKLFIFWGNSSPENNNSIDNIGFSLGEDFRVQTHLNLSNWINDAFVLFYSNKGILVDGNTILSMTATPFNNLNNWLMHIGGYVSTNPRTPTYNSSSTFNFNITGTQNPLSVSQYTSMGENNSLINNFAGGTNTTTISDGIVEKGLILNDFNNIEIKYYEPIDKIFYSLEGRTNVDDYQYIVERQVNGNTRLSSLQLSNFYSCPQFFIGWIYIKEYRHLYEPTFDTTSLTQGLEIKFEEPISTILYSSSFIKSDNYIYTDMGGDPTKLIDNSNSIWSSDILPTISGNIIIDTGIFGENLVDSTLVHYDSGHIDFNSASNLSDYVNDSSLYFRGTTTSGWIAISFSNPMDVGSLKLKGNGNYLQGLPTSFYLYGTNDCPYYGTPSDWAYIYDSTLFYTDSWQSFRFDNFLSFKYYVVYFPSTFGNDNITLSAWEMYSETIDTFYYRPGRLKLKPYSDEGSYIYFPKTIYLYGSNDYVNWTLLLNNTYTYTPLNGEWQNYTLANTNPYWVYKLVCIGNWNQNQGILKIAKIELLETLKIANSVFILEGISNDFKNISVDPNCAFDSGIFCAINDKVNMITNAKLTNSFSIEALETVNIVQ